MRICRNCIYLKNLSILKRDVVTRSIDRERKKLKSNGSRSGEYGGYGITNQPKTSITSFAMLTECEGDKFTSLKTIRFNNNYSKTTMSNSWFPGQSCHGNLMLQFFFCQFITYLPQVKYKPCNNIYSSTRLISYSGVVQGEILKHSSSNCFHAS